MQTTEGSKTAPIPGLESDEEGTRLVREEMRLLEIVHHALEVAARAEGARAHTGDDARLLELREEISTAKPEDLPALFEQMHHLGALRAQRGRGAAGVIDRKSPYFGHLRLEENGKRRDVLIGSRSYVDSSAGIRIVDWRHAPVSQIYYRYAQGDDYEERLGDRLVDGVVLARRSVAISNGELIRVGTPEGTFVRGREGAWRRIEARSSKLATERKWGDAGIKSARLGIGADGGPRQDKLLPAIASLLDGAQFELIAKPSAGLVAIQGSAGSGKTTVGLHRVAYLAFAEPTRFRSDRMLVVVPNDALIHYVSRVLPSLGVEGVPVSTFGKLAFRMVSTLFQRLPTRISEETPPVVSRAKAHVAMLHAIDSAVARIVARVEARIHEAMKRWPEGNRVIAAWEKTEGPVDVRVTMLAQWLVSKRTIPGAPPATGIPEVTRSAVESLGQELRALTRAVAPIWDELLTSRERLTETLSRAGFGSGQIEQVYEWCVRQARVRAEGERDGEVPTLDSEDLPLLLRSWQVLRGPLMDAEGKPIRYVHVFVDEVQDQSPIELNVLIDLAGKERCVTLAGDLAQRMLEDDDTRGEFDWRSLLNEIGAAQTTIEPLKVSYRSTAEITAFARSVLGPLAHEAEPIAPRNGPPVELFSFASPGEAVAFLADALKELAREEPEANVALVARFAQQAQVYYEGLIRAEVPNVRRVAKQNFTWEPGVDVTDIRQTKGLEFDEVVLLDTNASTFPTTGQARHALYVGATRAAHQLWCIATEKPSELVTTALTEAEAAASS